MCIQVRYSGNKYKTEPAIASAGPAHTRTQLHPTSIGVIFVNSHTSCARNASRSTGNKITFDSLARYALDDGQWMAPSTSVLRIQMLIPRQFLGDKCHKTNTGAYSKYYTRGCCPSAAASLPPPTGKRAISFRFRCLLDRKYIAHVPTGGGSEEAVYGQQPRGYNPLSSPLFVDDGGPRC